MSKRVSKHSFSQAKEERPGASSELPSLPIPFLKRLLGYALYALFPLLYALAGAWFVHIEKNAIYLWDFATYWNQVLQLKNFLKQGGSLWVALKTVYQSTTDTHYNLLPSLPLVPFQFLGFSNLRMTYIVGICFLYVGLLYLVCCYLYAKQADTKQKASAWLVGGLVCLTTCAIWWPVFRGFVDASALASALAGLAFCIRAENDKRAALCYFIGGLLLGLAPVIRKAYSFYLLAFVVTFSLVTFLPLFRKSLHLKEIWHAIRPKLFVFLGITAIFTIFYGFAINTVTADRSVHSSYISHESLWQQWATLLGWFGAIPCMAYGFGIWVLLKHGRLKGALLAGVLTSVLGAFLQMRTNALGEHHRYILVAGFLTVLSAALGVALSNWSQSLSRFFITLTALSCLGTLTDLHGAGSKGDFFPSAGPSPYGQREKPRPDWWLAAFGGAGPKPISRTDLGELQRLYAYVDRICATDPNPRVYILASGIVLGDGVVFSSLLTPPGLQLKSIGKFLPTQQIDSAHGAPTNLLHATHVITTDPIQLHLPPSSHKCVTVPWNQFKEGRGIARAFERTSEEFTLENNIKAFVYRRTRPTTQEDVAELESDLRKSGLIP
jgi:hypothetical protein